MKPKVVMMNRGRKQVVSHLEYQCRNQKTGCNYKVKSTVMESSGMIPLREDGSEAMR